MIQGSVLFTRIAMGVALGAAYAQVSAQQLAMGVKAPDFSAKASNGRTYKLDVIAKKGPVYLYFIKATCPMNVKAYRFFDQLVHAYKGKITFLGVIDGDQKALSEWKQKFGIKDVPFPVLFDSKRAIIRAYRVERSPGLVLIEKGKVFRTWPNYSTGILDDINRTMAATAKLKVPKKLDFSGAPREASGGCPFE